MGASRGRLEIVDHSGVPSDHDRLLPGQAVPAQRLRCLGLHAAAGRRERRICPEPGHLQEATLDGRGVPGVGVATARTGWAVDLISIWLGVKQVGFIFQGFQLIVLPDKSIMNPQQAPCCGGQLQSSYQSSVLRIRPPQEPSQEYLLSIGRIFHKISLSGSVITVTRYRPRCD